MNPRRLLFVMLGALPLAATAQGALTEQALRQTLGVGPQVAVAYRDLDCKSVPFEGFAEQMARPDSRSETDRSADGSAITVTVRLRGQHVCDSPYPRVTEMPPLDLRDLAGKRVTTQSLRGKPTLLSFFFATCLPCIREVQPFNEYRKSHPGMNFVSITFDEPEVARAFVKRFGVEWRVVPAARDFIERVRVKNYPTVALFDAQGRLLGLRAGGAKDELEAANVIPQLNRWVEGLMRGAQRN